MGRGLAPRRGVGVAGGGKGWGAPGLELLEAPPGVKYQPKCAALTRPARRGVRPAPEGLQGFGRVRGGGGSRSITRGCAGRRPPPLKESPPH